MFGDNNGVAVGMWMLVPILIALARTAPKAKEKYFHRFLAIGVVYRAISTYSRGGFLTGGALALNFLFRSKRKFAALAGLVVVALLVMPVLPQEFWDRMNTINQARDDSEEDADLSAEGRIHFWKVAVAMAADRPLTGVGHNSYTQMYNQYNTDPDYDVFGENRAVHSTWFGMLSELGYPGLILFVLIILNAFRACRRTRKLAKIHPELEHFGIYANAVEAALISFLVGGTFIIFQYNEMLWHMLGLSIVIESIAVEAAARLTQPQDVAVPLMVKPSFEGAAIVLPAPVIPAPLRRTQV